MADPSPAPVPPVRVTLDIPRADLNQAVTSAMREQVKASLDEAIQAFKNDISGQLEGTKDKVDRARTQMDGIHDLVREKEDVIRKKLDELLARIEAEHESAKKKIKEIEEDLNTKVVRYLVPAGLVVLTSLVLGAVTIFGGFKVQDKVSDALAKAQILSDNVAQANIKFVATKSILDTLDTTIDETNKKSLIGANASLVDANVKLQGQIVELRNQVKELREETDRRTDKSNSGNGTGTQKVQKKTDKK